MSDPKRPAFELYTEYSPAGSSINLPCSHLLRAAYRETGAYPKLTEDQFVHESIAQAVAAPVHSVILQHYGQAVGGYAFILTYEIGRGTFAYPLHTYVLRGYRPVGTLKLMRGVRDYAKGLGLDGLVLINNPKPGVYVLTYKEF